VSSQNIGKSMSSDKTAVDFFFLSRIKTPAVVDSTLNASLQVKDK
jgi:hypothetical protein